MTSGRDSYEKTRQEMLRLIGRHQKTRMWFRRTGSASLVAAVLWIIMYNAMSEQAAVKETLAVILGAGLMWILFIWAFFLHRKLSIITADIRILERKMAEFVHASAIPPEDANRP
jgi:hypothetical protein